MFKKFKKPGGAPTTAGKPTMSNQYEDAMSRALAKRHKQQLANKDQKGVSKRDTLFDHKGIPEGMPIWYAKEGSHIIDIIPFVAGPDMPLARDTTDVVTEEGEFDYLLDIEVHRNIGEMRKDYVCPRINFGLPCPICSYMDANRLETEDWKKVKTSRRVIYFVWVHDTPEEEAKGLQLWHVSHFYMEAKLDALVKLPQGGGVRQFSHPDHGYNIAFEVQKEGKTKLNYVGHALYNRDRPIPRKLLNMAFPITQAINLKVDYDEMEKAFFGTLRSLKSAPENSTAGDNYRPNPEEDDIPLNVGGSAPDWYEGEDDTPKSPAPSTGKKRFVIKRKK